MSSVLGEVNSGHTMIPQTNILLLILLFGFSLLTTYGSILGSQGRNFENDRSDAQEDKKIDILTWLLRSNASESRTASPQESLTLGPLEISKIGNSSLKRVRLAPWFEKNLRDEIYRRNQATNLDSRSRDLPFLKRTARSLNDASSISKRQGLQGLGFSSLGSAGSITPQQYLLMQQQQEQEQRMVAAAAVLQQQMLTLQNQRYNQLGQQRQRPYRYQNYDDDDDSDSDEDDEFDSDEFMSFPIRMGFMPPIPGFQG